MDQFTRDIDLIFKIKNCKTINDNKTDILNWITLLIVSVGTLMVVMGETIVNIALPAIKIDLGLSESTLSWVITIYLLSFGSFLLISGKLGDIFGYRKIFLLGITIYSVASLSLVLNIPVEVFLVARAIQGIAGACISVVSLSEILTLFTETKEKTKALGIFAAVMSAGGSIGVLLGGILTNYGGWHLIFLINIPIGLIIILTGFIFMPLSKSQIRDNHLDIWGAISITGVLTILLFMVSTTQNTDWVSQRTIYLSLIAVILFILFVFVEKKSVNPLIPLKIFKLRSIIISNGIAIFCSSAMLVWSFFTVLYLQLILNFSPLQSALVFMPATIATALFSIFLSGKSVVKFGIKKNISVGLALTVIGLVVLARVNLAGTEVTDILPAMIFLGLASGIIFNPLLLLATKDINESDSGIASGIVNASFMMGGALGLALTINVTSFFKTNIEILGFKIFQGLVGIYQFAFVIGALFAFIAFLLGIFFIQT